MTGLVDPVDRQLLRALRGAVAQLRAGHRERSFPLHVTVSRVDGPDPHRETFLSTAVLDLDLRIEVVSALLLRSRSRLSDRHRSPVAWLARPGALTWHDRDADWLPAALAAYAEAGLPLDFVVLTKQGWYDPRSGVSRRWKRLRSVGAAGCCP